MVVLRYAHEILHLGCEECAVCHTCCDLSASGIKTTPLVCSRSLCPVERSRAGLVSHPLNMFRLAPVLIGAASAVYLRSNVRPAQLTLEPVAFHMSD